MRRAERGASLGMPFRVPRQVAISSERRSFEPAGVKRNHTDLHIMIYILVLCLLCSFSSRRPCLPSTTHHGLDSSSLLSLPLYLSSLSLSLSLPPSLSLSYSYSRRYSRTCSPTFSLVLSFSHVRRAIGTDEKYGFFFFTAIPITKNSGQVF